MKTNRGTDHTANRSIAYHTDLTQQAGFLLPNYDTVAKEAAGIDLHITQTKRLGLIVINHQASTVRQ